MTPSHQSKDQSTKHCARSAVVGCCRLEPGKVKCWQQRRLTGIERQIRAAEARCSAATVNKFTLPEVDVDSLQPEVKAQVEALLAAAEMIVVRAQCLDELVGFLKDEIAILKRLKKRPVFKASGMHQKAEAAAQDEGGATRDGPPLPVTPALSVVAAPPARAALRRRAGRKPNVQVRRKEAKQQV